VKRAERNLAVEVEGEDVFLARPVVISSPWHGRASELSPRTISEVMDFRATSVAMSKIVQRSKCMLRIAVVGQSLVVNLTIVVQQTRAMGEQFSFRFVVFLPSSMRSLVIVDMAWR